MGIRALLEGMTSENEGGNTELLNTIAHIPIAQISVNPYQPRIDFDEAALQELASSIKIHGLIQPLTVRMLTPESFQLISGERRLRASTLAGLTEVPAYVRLANDQEMLEMALIENIQREDLNPIEVSLSYQRLIDECSLKHEELGDRVGKNRSTVTNYLRLLKLPPEIQKGLKSKTLSMGHARALINMGAIDKQLLVYQEILQKHLSVRQVEDLVRNMENSAKKTPIPPPNSLAAPYRRIQSDLSDKFETKVNLKADKNGKGQITITFADNDDLNRILDLILL